MRTTLYDRAGRFVAQFSEGKVANDSTAILWEQRPFLRQDDGDYVEVSELPAGMVPVCLSLDLNKRPAEKKDFGEPGIGNEKQQW